MHLTLEEGALRAKGSFNSNDIFSTRLFLGQLTFEKSVSSAYYVKSDGNSLMGLKLSFSSNLNQITQLLLLPEAVLPKSQLTGRYDRIIMAQKSSSQDLSLDSGWVKYESSIMMNGHTLTKIELLCYFKKPVKANASSSNKTASRIADGSPYKASLGLIRMQISGQNIEFPSADSWIVHGDNISWSLNKDGVRTISLKITWKLKAETSQAFVLYIIYVQKVSKDRNNQDYIIASPAEFVAEITRKHLMVLKQRWSPNHIP